MAERTQAARFAEQTRAAEGRLPHDPADYVSAAEDLTNFGDPRSVRELFSDAATFETITDGATRIYRGREEITRGWIAITRAFRPRGFRVRKRLLVAADDVIVEEWEGRWGDGTPARGIEVWRFDADARICECRLYSYLDVKPESSWAQRLRMLLRYPGIALAVLREQRRTRVC